MRNPIEALNRKMFESRYGEKEAEVLMALKGSDRERHIAMLEKHGHSASLAGGAKQIANIANNIQTTLHELLQLRHEIESSRYRLFVLSQQKSDHPEIVARDNEERDELSTKARLLVMQFEESFPASFILMNEQLHQMVSKMYASAFGADGASSFTQMKILDRKDRIRELINEAFQGSDENDARIQAETMMQFVALKTNLQLKLEDLKQSLERGASYKPSPELDTYLDAKIRLIDELTILHAHASDAEEETSFVTSLRHNTHQWNRVVKATKQ